jgi:hypothetical protein
MKITATTTAQYVYPVSTEISGAFIIQNLDAAIGIWASIHGVATSNPTDNTLDPGMDSFFLAAGQSLIVDDGGLNRRVGGRVSVVAASGTASVNVCRLR